MALYAHEDRVARLLREKTIARAFAICIFIGLLWLFRDLWPVFVSFVLCAKGLNFCIRISDRHLRLPKNWTIGILTTLVLGLFALLVFLVYDPLASLVDGAIESLPRWQHDVQAHPLFRRLQRTFRDTDMLAAHVGGYATTALSMVTAIGRFFVQATLGFIMALVFVFEEDKLEAFVDTIAPKSLFGRLLRWGGHVADAIAVTVQLQLVVAVFNTVTTLPVLLVLGVDNVPTLMLMVFVSALIPVIGNLAAGVVLCFFSFQAKGWLGVAIFIGVTALLGKVESYYLSPRLTARHVKMPSFILVASLVAFEQVFGFAGFFLSFPFLFVAGRIRAEFHEEEGILPPRSIDPKLILTEDDAPASAPGPRSLRFLHEPGAPLSSRAVDTPLSPTADTKVSVAPEARQPASHKTLQSRTEK